MSLFIVPTPDGEYAPAGEEAYTLDLELDGYVNGRMDPNRMMWVGRCQLERDAAYMYSLLMEAARRDGVYLVPIDCYRSYSRQKTAFDTRCPLTEVEIYDTDPITGEKLAAGTKTVRVCTGPPTARPGLSNHGWGRAVDFGDGYGRVLTCYSSGFRWLQSNAHRFGWVHPLWAQCNMVTREPWHWEWAGVTDPTLVPFDRYSAIVQFVE